MDDKSPRQLFRIKGKKGPSEIDKAELKKLEPGFHSIYWHRHRTKEAGLLYPNSCWDRRSIDVRLFGRLASLGMSTLPSHPAGVQHLDRQLSLFAPLG